MCRKVTDYATGPKPDLKKDTSQSHTPWTVTDTSQEAVVPSSLLLPLIFLFLALPQQLWRPRSTVTAAEHTRPGVGVGAQLCCPDIALFGDHLAAEDNPNWGTKVPTNNSLADDQVPDNKQL